LNTTVSIGLSVHPCGEFAKRDILDNARKALVHTGFFGPDTQTFFDAVSLNINGDRLYEAGRMDEAVEEFHKALALDPENVNVHNSLGVCQAQEGCFEEAVAAFTRAAELAPTDFMPQYNLGCALLGLGREDEAEKSFSRAAEMDQDHAGICFQLGKLCKQQNRLEEAITHFKRALELRSGWAQTWRLLGESYLEKGVETEAMNAFKQALKYNGKDALALSGLAMAYGGTESNLDIALSLARRSVELEPQNGLLVERLAELLLKNGEFAEAAEQCDRALALSSEDQRIQQLRDKISAAQRASTS
jgi:Flp pilus assembly protein TadD